jgi:hypothetical protein
MQIALAQGYAGEDPIVRLEHKFLVCSSSSSSSSSAPPVMFAHMHPFHLWMGPGTQGKSAFIHQMQGLEEVD